MGPARTRKQARTQPVQAPDGVYRAAQHERFRALTLHAESSDTVKAARDMTRATLTDWGLEGVADDARLVVSELVGNVINHAVPDPHLAKPGASRRIDVILRAWPPMWLFIGVADEDSSAPTYPAGETFAPDLAVDLPEAVLPASGRGLFIVHRLVDALWWVPQEHGGKIIFCRFDLTPQALTP